MKFAVVLLVFTVCGTFAEPKKLNPIKFGLRLGNGGINTAAKFAHGGINFAGNILNGIFGGGQGHHSKGGAAGGAVQQEIQIIITLIQRLQAAISSGNIGQITIIITEILPKLQVLAGKLPGGARGLIQLIIQNITKLKTAAKGGNKGGANSIIIQIESQLKQVAASAKGGAGAKGGAKANGGAKGGATGGIHLGGGAKAGLGGKGGLGGLGGAAKGALGGLGGLGGAAKGALGGLGGHGGAGKGALGGLGGAAKGALGGLGGAGKGHKKNLSKAQIMEIYSILTRIVGPKLAKLVTGLLVALANHALGKVKLSGILKPVIGIVIKLLKSHGLAEKLLAGGNPKAKFGKNITPQEQARLTAILNQTVGPFTSKYLVTLVTLLTNGLLGKIPVGKLLKPVLTLVEKLLGGHNILSKLLGRKGLGGPISKLLGAKGKGGDALGGILGGIGGSVSGTIGGLGGKGGKGPHGKQKNLTPQELAEIYSILEKVVGPKLAKVLVKLVGSLTNGVLGKVHLHALLKLVPKLLTKLLGGGHSLLGSKGLVGKLLGGGHPGQADGSAKQKNGKLKNLTPADQRRLIIILTRTVGPYTAANVVHLLAVLINGLLGKIPLHKLLHGVGGLVNNLLKKKGLVGKLVGRKGLGGLVSKLLGANPKADATVKSNTAGSGINTNADAGNPNLNIRIIRRTIQE